MALAIALALLATPALAADPPVPAGMASGGVPVAVISGGFDYTKPHIAQMLARDGEGEITGFDYIDEDRRPFATETDSEGTRIAEVLIGEGQAVSLVAVRARTTDPISMTKALKFVTQGPAPIVAIDCAFVRLIDIAMVASAARHYNEHLFIVRAGAGNVDLDTRVLERFRNVMNLIVVAAAGDDGALDSQSNFGNATVDIGADIVSRFGQADEAPTPSAERQSSLALARITALAARLLAIEPHVKGAALKERIMRLAVQNGPTGGAKTRFGTIHQPQRYFWLE